MAQSLAKCRVFVYAIWIGLVVEVVPGRGRTGRAGARRGPGAGAVVAAGRGAVRRPSQPRGRAGSIAAVSVAAAAISSVTGRNEPV